MTVHRANRPELPKVYPSAVDLWLAAVLFSSPAFATGLGLYLWTQGETRGAIILLITAIATLILTFAFVLPCRYTLLENELHVRCGIIAYRIPLKSIERIERSRTLASGPALSLKRVIVFTRLKNYILSPRDRDEFLSDVSAAVAVKRGHQSES